MRSSRSEADPLDPGGNGFAHRGLHQAPRAIENSAGAFAAAMELGAGIECDLRLTLDDRVIVFHDANAQRLCGSSEIIGRSTLVGLAHLRVGGEPIPTLTQILELVAGRVPLLLEAKVDSDAGRFARALAAALDGYTGPFGVMSFHPGVLARLKAHAPRLRRGLVIRDSLSAPKRWIAMKLADPAFLAVDLAAIDRPWVARARTHLPIYTWTVRTLADRARALAKADALIWEADGRP
jgi:glycerophosphoryl diester phosphodiesterase